MRLRFTMDRRHGRPRELIGAWPPATLGLKVAGEGTWEVEEAAVSTFVGSSELGRWGNGGVVERDDRRRSVLGGGLFQCGRGGERDGEWCGMLQGGGSPIIWAREGAGAAITAGIRGETGGGVNGSFKRLEARIQGG
jgi:hypothetical protein